MNDDYNKFTSNVWVQTKNFNSMMLELKSLKDKNKIQKFNPLFKEIKNYL